jgi:diguanylate cyclase (GGDEF)-like protein
MAGRVELDVYPVFEKALLFSAEALQAPMACLHLADDDEGVLTMVRGHRLDPFWARAWNRLSLSGPTPPARVHASGRILELAGDQAPTGLKGLVTAPVRGGEISVGTLSFLWPQPLELPSDPDRLEFLATVGYSVGLSIEHAGLISEMVDNLNELMALKAQAEERNQQLAELNEQLSQANLRLEELSITDPLTGIFNRRYLVNNLEQEIIRSRRQGYPVSVIMADLDHFKQVNDRLGHQTGDEALKLFAGWIESGVRETDTVGRYGGEEFLVILLDCDLSSAVQVAEKLRAMVETNSRVPLLQDLGGFTVSMGVALLTQGMDAQALIAQADEALYIAKKNGRNRVEAAA